MSWYEEHQQLLQNGQFADALRLSGEQLALISGRLAKMVKQPEDDPTKIETAREVLYAANTHGSDLFHAGDFKEAVSMALMVPTLIIKCRVNPETLPDMYLAWLQLTLDIFGRIALTQPGADANMNEHLELLMELVMVTGNDYTKRLNMPEHSVKDFETFRQAVRPNGQGSSTSFQGEPITPMMALDILTYILVDLQAQGWFSVDE